MTMITARLAATSMMVSPIAAIATNQHFAVHIGHELVPGSRLQAVLNNGAIIRIHRENANAIGQINPHQ